MKSAQRKALPDSTRSELDLAGKADIVVGVPAYNCSATVGNVVDQCAKGLDRFFSERRAFIIVSDGGSSDGTIEAASSIQVPPNVQVVVTGYEGVSGKGTALRAVFESALAVGAKAAAVVDSDLRSISPEWMDLLLSTVFKGADLVAPVYMRHKYDGTLTNFLCYPFISALYGRKIRQPIGGDFGFSKRLIDEMLRSSLWETPYVPRFGIDIFMTQTALAKGLNVRQAFLGSKIHEVKSPGAQLGSMFHQVAGAMFSCAREYEEAWRNIGMKEEPEIVSKGIQVNSPEEIRVDAQDLVDAFIDGIQPYASIYADVFTPDVLNYVKSLGNSVLPDFEFGDEEWAKCVYSFVTAFKRSESYELQSNLLEALRALWKGKLASFVVETSDSDYLDCENRVEKEVDTFIQWKPYLTSRF